MRAYSIFDDFTEDAIRVLTAAGIEIVVHPKRTPRPDDIQMKTILKDYDCVIIGTSQKITEDMFDSIDSPRIIATASVGLDHIHVPDGKNSLVTILNTPKANAQSVAEYTIGCALLCCKRLFEGKDLYLQGKNNKQLYQKPDDLAGKTLGVVGAGNISAKIIEYGRMMGMHVSCWTAHPELHPDLKEKGLEFIDLDKLLSTSDVISVNLPNNSGTCNLISSDRVQGMRDDAIFISVSRMETVDYKALFEKAKQNRGFYVCLDLDVNVDIIEAIYDTPNIIVTPHIAGGTTETRKRMFLELARQITEVKGLQI